ncbi:protease inhibitor I42 family protein [Dankookia sp. GCM10030260]|uniref:protease inhibitor I42 family protein n=1 Tax=Dankookia sp. GCM10030260 TaxID=3273390 RepID=UPI003622C207
MPDPETSTLDLAVGAVGEVPLERYGTAGYAWEVMPPPAGIAELAILPRAGGAGTVGGATLEVLRLRAAAPGEHVVVLRLRRPWESTATRELRITVRAR